MNWHGWWWELGEGIYIAGSSSKGRDMQLVLFGVEEACLLN